MSRAQELVDAHFDVVPGYEPLAEVFQIAHDQAARGKGLERHANAKPFLQQPIFAIGRMVGVGYNVGQAMKKGQESMRLPDGRAQAELLGAMVYLASAYLLIGERMEAAKRAAVSDIPIGNSNISVCANCTSHCDQFSLFRTVCAASAARGALANDAAHKAPSLCDSEVKKVRPCDDCSRKICSNDWVAMANESGICSERNPK